MVRSDFVRLPKSGEDEAVGGDSTHAFEIRQNEHNSSREEIQRQGFAVNYREIVGNLVNRVLRNKIKAAILSAVAILLIVLALAFGTTCDNVLEYEYSPPLRSLGNLDVFAQNQTIKPFRVLMYGDSLVGWPHEENNLDEKILGYLPSHQIRLFEKYYFGRGIGILRENLADALSSATMSMGGIDAVILFWDTDASDTDWIFMSRADQIAFREKYYADLTYVIQHVKESVPFLAIAGPLVSGEGPLFDPFHFNGVTYAFSTFRKKYQEYRTINRAVCAVHRIPYIDVRQAFLDATPFMRLGFSGCLTIDGEHENERGTAIVAKLFAETIFGFMYRDAIRTMNGTSKYISEIYRPARKVLMSSEL